MRSRFPLLLASLSLALGVGCGDSPTAIYVVIETDVAQATSIHIDVMGPAESMTRDVTLDADTARPLQLTLEPGEGTALDAAVSLRVEVRGGATTLLTRRVETRFVPHRVSVLVLRLSESCRNATCAEECDDGTCVPRLQTDLPEWNGTVPDASIRPLDGGVELDGGEDAAVDGGPTDGAVTCVAPHDGGPGTTCDRLDAGVEACPAPFECRSDQSEVNICWVRIEVARISAGPEHTCAVGTQSRVVCWGEAAGGRLGGTPSDDGVAATNDLLVVVPGIVDATRVAAGDDFSCAIHRGGRIACWGAGADAWVGACSGGPLELRLPGGRSAREIDAGDGYACAIATDGTAWCWGESDGNRLGSAAADSVIPVRVGELVELEGITVGSAHACAWTDAGAGVCWGANASGQLGDRAPTASRGPTPIDATFLIDGLTAGEAHTCALSRAPRRVLCWGANDHGQLGSAGADSLAPVAVPAQDDATDVVAGWGHTCSIRNATLDGGVDPVAFCWGDDRSEQTGASGGSSAMRAHAYNTARALALGREHTCFVDEGGVQCFGGNDAHQLGDATSASTATAQRVSGLR